MNALSGLQEYEEVLVRTRYPKVAIQRAFRTLMQRQFIFGNDFGSKDIYELLIDDQVRPFAERLFDVFVWRLQFNTSGNIKMVCPMPPIAEAPDTPRDKREAHQAQPLRVDEAVAILLLRAYYDSAIAAVSCIEVGSQRPKFAKFPDSREFAWRRVRSALRRQPASHSTEDSFVINLRYAHQWRVFADPGLVSSLKICTISGRNRR
jgi:hypothetical protein